MGKPHFRGDLTNRIHMKIESTRSVLSVNSPFEKGLIPVEQEVYTIWSPEIGCWYTAPAAGRIGGKTVPAGARYRLVERGNPHQHSVWEVILPIAPGDRVVYTDEDGNQHAGTVLLVDGSLLEIAFDDGEQGWERVEACAAADGLVTQ